MTDEPDSVDETEGDAVANAPRSDPSTWPRDLVLCDGVPIEGIDLEDALRNLDLPAVDQ